MSIIMQIEKNKLAETFGRIIGYVFAYIVFTTILYFLLRFINKLPSSWTYFHVAGVTICISLIGIIIKRLLK